MSIQDSTVSNTLSTEDKRRFSLFSDHFNGFLVSNSEEISTTNRNLDPEVGQQVIKMAARPSLLPPHYCVLHADKGRTSKNVPKRNNKGEVIKRRGKVVWAHEYGVCTIWTAKAFREMRAEKNTSKKKEVLYRIPWSEVPKKFRKVLVKGAKKWDGKPVRIDGELAEIAPKIRQPKQEGHKYLKPTHVGLLMRQKKGQKWSTPQWLVLGTWGSKLDSKRIPVVLETALCWKRGCIPSLADLSNAPNDIVPTLWDRKQESKPEVEVSEVSVDDDMEVSTDILF